MDMAGSVASFSLGCLRTPTVSPSASGFDQQDENWNEAIRGRDPGDSGDPLDWIA